MDRNTVLLYPLPFSDEDQDRMFRLHKKMNDPTIDEWLDDKPRKAPTNLVFSAAECDFLVPNFNSFENFTTPLPPR